MTGPSGAAAAGPDRADAPHWAHRYQGPRRSRAAKIFESGFRHVASLRSAPALHPRGLTCSADVEVMDDGAGRWGVPWLDSPRTYEATVRLSRAAGLPDRLPDGLGLAVRISGVDEPAGVLDLLLTGSGRNRFTRHLPLPRVDALRGPYSSLLPYRVRGHRRTLAAFPRPRPAPVPGYPASLARALTAGPLVFDLCADSAGRTWRRFAVLTVTNPLPVAWDASPGFDVYRHRARGFEPVSTLATARRAAYWGSRNGRHGEA